jgi:hypothetical protein
VPCEVCGFVAVVSRELTHCFDAFATQRGHAFVGKFRVNAHNRNEASTAPLSDY